MLSAIAARKAAKAARQLETPASEPEPVVTPPISKPSSKRKPSSTTQVVAPPERTKRRRRTKNPKIKHKEEHTRYFTVEAEDGFKKGSDIIVLEESDSSDEQEFASGAVTPAKQLPLASTLVDSSDEEDNEKDQASDVTENEDPGLSTLDTRLHPITSPLPPEPPFTFCPSPSTVIPLSSVDLASIPLTRSSTSPAVVAILGSNETLALMGTYTLSVLAGSVELCGVVLRAGSEDEIQCYDVYTPRSSPLPVIRVLEESDVQKLPDTLEHRVPSRIRSLVSPQPGAVILVQGLRTGIEGLGRVCRPFDGVFSPPSWQKGKNADADTFGGIPGVYMVTRETYATQPFFQLDPSWDTALQGVLSASNHILAKTKDMEMDMSTYNEAKGRENLELGADTFSKSSLICLTKGAKKSGKSTIARTLLNRLLTQYKRVAFLECDLGQSEFTPGGMVALNIVETPVFGPPFTHPALPYRAHYIGAASPRNAPGHYIRAIRALVQTYEDDIRYPPDSISRSPSPSPSKSTSTPLNRDTRICDMVPLVVNTMGWTKGLGADLTRSIENLVCPTHVLEVAAPDVYSGSVSTHTPRYYMQSQEQDYSISGGPLIHDPTVIHYTLNAVQPSILGTNYTAADHRAISLLSYFHAVFPAVTPSTANQGPGPQVTATAWDTSLPLLAKLPYAVSIGDTPSRGLDAVILSGAGAEDVVPVEAPRVLNGALVGLVRWTGSNEIGADAVWDGDGFGTIWNDEDSSTSQNVEASPIPYVPARPPPAPHASTCVGLALVRSLHPANTELHVLTPAPPRTLGGARVFVKGELELPVWGMLDFREAAGGAGAGNWPYLQWGKGTGVGGERKRVRRNLMRRGQM